MECTSTGAYVLHYLVKGNKASIMDIPKLRNEEEGGVPSYWKYPTVSVTVPADWFPIALYV